MERLKRTQDGICRKNNNVEGWHNVLLLIENNKHLLMVIDTIKSEQSMASNLFVQLSSGYVNKRKPAYVILEEKISTIVSEYKYSEV